MFQDRSEAGLALAERLAGMELPDPLVLALPRGGVPVAVPIARRLAAPLDLALVRKIGTPGHEELAAGAILLGASGEDVVFNQEVLRHLGLRPDDFAEAVRMKRAELMDRRRRYLGGRSPEPVAGRSVVLVDDGIATGTTVRVALQGLRRQQPARIVLAVPVASPESIAMLRPLVDDLICLETPPQFHAVGLHYRDFAQVGDDAVVRWMEEFGNNHAWKGPRE